MPTLAEKISKYREILPEIREEFGSVWVVLADDDLSRTFDKFSEAADYAIQNFTPGSYLIRHTDERRETIPYAVIEA
jgi:hypothetical protein